MFLAGEQIIKKEENTMKSTESSKAEEHPKTSKEKSNYNLGLLIERTDKTTLQDLYDFRLWICAKADRMGFNVHDK